MGKAQVTYKKGITVNTGNFESVRYEFMVTRECEDEDVEELTESIKSYVNEEIAKCTSETKGIPDRSGNKKKETIEDLLV